MKYRLVLHQIDPAFEQVAAEIEDRITLLLAGHQIDAERIVRNSGGGVVKARSIGLWTPVSRLHRARRCPRSN